MPTITAVPFQLTGSMYAMRPIKAVAFTLTLSLGTPTISTATKDLYKPYFKFVLTGQPNVEIPISSFQCRLRASDPSFLSVTIPGSTYADEIADRSTDGKLRLFKGYYDKQGNVEQEDLIAEAILDNVDIQESVGNYLIILNGHIIKNYGAKAITLTGVSYRNEIDGVVRLRFPYVDTEVKPGDTLTAGSDTITIDEVVYSMNPSLQQMEVVEVSS